MGAMRPFPPAPLDEPGHGAIIAVADKPGAVERPEGRVGISGEKGLEILQNGA